MRMHARSRHKSAAHIWLPRQSSWPAPSTLWCANHSMMRLSTKNVPKTCGNRRAGELQRRQPQTSSGTHTRTHRNLAAHQSELPQRRRDDRRVAGEQEGDGQAGERYSRQRQVVVCHGLEEQQRLHCTEARQRQRVVGCEDLRRVGVLSRRPAGAPGQTQSAAVSASSPLTCSAPIAQRSRCVSAACRSSGASPITRRSSRNMVAKPPASRLMAVA